MNIYSLRSVGALLLIVAIVAVTSCNDVARAVITPQPMTKEEEPTLVKVEGKKAPVDLKTTLDQVREWSSARLKQSDFRALDEAADSARRTNQRIIGGFQKLYGIYKGLSEPNSFQNEAEVEWERHFTLLNAWKEANPQSITARIALAESWAAYGLAARGEGFADTVSEENVKLFLERIQRSRTELEAARNIGIKCPEWYPAMLKVALAQGWNYSEYNRVFEEGFLLEPTYINLHREKLGYLMPQWHGKKGDLVRFIDEISKRIEGDEGEIMLFALVGSLQQAYRGDIFREIPIPWQRVKSGYEKLRKHYGVDRYRMNQFAYLSIYGADLDASVIAFDEVGDNWDKDVWGIRDRFDQTKQMLASYVEQRAKYGPLPPSNGNPGNGSKGKR